MSATNFPTSAQVAGFDSEGNPVKVWAVDARERMSTVPPSFFLTWPPPAQPVAVTAPAEPVSAPIVPKK